jgi:hypothetical protein
MPCGQFKVATMRHLHVIENISKLIPASEASGFNMSAKQLVSAAKEAIKFLLYGFAAHVAADLTEGRACASRKAVIYNLHGEKLRLHRVVTS